MSEERKGPTTGRRDFLKLATVAAPAAALAAVAAPGAAGAAAPAVGDGYRETDHVRKYLDSARF